MSTELDKKGHARNDFCVNGSIFMEDLSPGWFGWFCLSEVLAAELFPPDKKYLDSS